MHEDIEGELVKLLASEIGRTIDLEGKKALGMIPTELRYGQKAYINYTGLDGPSYEEEPRRVCEIMQGVMNGTKCRHQEMYNKHVLGINWISQTEVRDKLPSIVSFEIGPFVWIVFNKYGSWPAIHRRSNLDDSNYLTYKQKGSDVFVLDNNRGMVRADY